MGYHVPIPTNSPRSCANYTIRANTFPSSLRLDLCLPQAAPDLCQVVTACQHAPGHICQLGLNTRDTVRGPVTRAWLWMHSLFHINHPRVAVPSPADDHQLSSTKNDSKWGCKQSSIWTIPIPGCESLNPIQSCKCGIRTHHKHGPACPHASPSHTHTEDRGHAAPSRSIPELQQGHLPPAHCSAASGTLTGPVNWRANCI